MWNYLSTHENIREEAYALKEFGPRAPAVGRRTSCLRATARGGAGPVAAAASCGATP
jgi:hypothetical protein